MSNLFLSNFNVFDKALSKDDFDMLDEVLDDFLDEPLPKMSAKDESPSSTSLCEEKVFVNVIVIFVAPQRPETFHSCGNS